MENWLISQCCLTKSHGAREVGATPVIIVGGETLSMQTLLLGKEPWADSLGPRGQAQPLAVRGPQHGSYVSSEPVPPHTWVCALVMRTGTQRAFFSS